MVCDQVIHDSAKQAMNVLPVVTLRLDAPKSQKT